jgi:DNA polymerase-4
VSDAPYPPRSRGREETYQENIADPERIREAVVRLAQRVSDDIDGIDGGERPAVRVVVKVRFAPFFTETHGVALNPPTSAADEITAAALAALDRFTLDRSVRLLGVRAELRR